MTPTPKPDPTPTPKPDPAPQPEPQPTMVDVRRYYNPNSGEHFYTIGTAEQKALVKSGWRDEGVAFTAK